MPNSVAEAPNSPPPPPLDVCEGGGKDMAARPLPARCNPGRKNDASIPAKQRVVTGHRGGGRGCGRGQLKKGLVLAAPPTPRGGDAASQQPPTAGRVNPWMARERNRRASKAVPPQAQIPAVVLASNEDAVVRPVLEEPSRQYRQKLLAAREQKRGAAAQLRVAQERKQRHQQRNHRQRQRGGQSCAANKDKERAAAAAEVAALPNDPAAAARGRVGALQKKKQPAGGREARSAWTAGTRKAAGGGIGGNGFAGERHHGHIEMHDGGAMARGIALGGETAVRTQNDHLAPPPPPAVLWRLQQKQPQPQPSEPAQLPQPQPQPQPQPEPGPELEPDPEPSAIAATKTLAAILGSNTAEEGTEEALSAIDFEVVEVDVQNLAGEDNTLIVGGSSPTKSSAHCAGSNTVETLTTARQYGPRRPILSQCVEAEDRGGDIDRHHDDDANADEHAEGDYQSMASVQNVKKARGSKDAAPSLPPTRTREVKSAWGEAPGVLRPGTGREWDEAHEAATLSTCSSSLSIEDF